MQQLEQRAVALRAVVGRGGSCRSDGSWPQGHTSYRSRREETRVGRLELTAAPAARSGVAVEADRRGVWHRCGDRDGAQPRYQRRSAPADRRDSSAGVMGVVGRIVPTRTGAGWARRCRQRAAAVRCRPSAPRASWSAERPRSARCWPAAPWLTPAPGQAAPPGAEATGGGGRPSIAGGMAGVADGTEAHVISVSPDGCPRAVSAAAARTSTELGKKRTVSGAARRSMHRRCARRDWSA